MYKLYTIKPCWKLDNPPKNKQTNKQNNKNKKKTQENTALSKFRSPVSEVKNSRKGCLTRVQNKQWHIHLAPLTSGVFWLMRLCVAHFYITVTSSPHLSHLVGIIITCNREQCFVFFFFSAIPNLTSSHWSHDTHHISSITYHYITVFLKKIIVFSITFIFFFTYYKITRCSWLFQHVSQTGITAAVIQWAIEYLLLSTRVTRCNNAELCLQQSLCDKRYNYIRLHTSKNPSLWHLRM